MLLGAFRPQTTPEDKKPETLSEADLQFRGPPLETRKIILNKIFISPARPPGYPESVIRLTQR
jgi:hypothetical protein